MIGRNTQSRFLHTNKSPLEPHNRQIQALTHLALTKYKCPEKQLNTMPDASETTDTDGFRARPVDLKILSLLEDGRETGDPWGRDSPGRIAEHIDFSTQHVINRLNILEAAGLVRKLERGVWEITDDGVDKVSE